MKAFEKIDWIIPDKCNWTSSTICLIPAKKYCQVITLKWTHYFYLNLN